MPLFLQPSFDFLRPDLRYKILVLEPTSHDQPFSVGLDDQLGQLIFKPFLPYVVELRFRTRWQVRYTCCVVAALHHDQQNQG